MKKKTKPNIKIKCLCLAVILILVAGCATRGGSERVGQAVITGIDITDNKLNIVADKPLTSFIRVSPDDLQKVIVEVPDARLGITSVKIKSNSTGIVEIVSSQAEEPLLARFEILLRAPVTSLPVSMESASSVDNKDTSLSIKVKEKNGVEIVFEESPAPQEKIQKAELFEARKEEKEVESGDTNKKSVPLRIIIVSGEKDASEILSELKKGKSFAFLAKEKSIDESRGGYGYIGNVAISKLKAPLREAVTRLKDGETSGAIKLEDDRYAIVQVIDQSY
ncbi:MAG: peptidylprolyl isomerase, partial [Nitrospirota bacterium]|nr:peptidylprolyl isomerase [Nitrospirota bacterium]